MANGSRPLRPRVAFSCWLLGLFLSMVAIGWTWSAGNTTGLALACAVGAFGFSFKSGGSKAAWAGAALLLALASGSLALIATTALAAAPAFLLQFGKASWWIGDSSRQPPDGTAAGATLDRLSIRGTGPGGARTTDDLLDAARAAEPGVWGRVGKDDDPFDGPVLPGGVTWFAADAVGIAVELARTTGAPLDLRTLAAGAGLAREPRPAIAEGLPRSFPEDLVQQAAIRYATSPHGHSMMLRVEATQSLRLGSLPADERFAHVFGTIADAAPAIVADRSDPPSTAAFAPAPPSSPGPVTAPGPMLLPPPSTALPPAPPQPSGPTTSIYEHVRRTGPLGPATDARWTRPAVRSAEPPASMVQAQAVLDVSSDRTLGLGVAIEEGLPVAAAVVGAVLGTLIGAPSRDLLLTIPGWVLAAASCGALAYFVALGGRRRVALVVAAGACLLANSESIALTLAAGALPGLVVVGVSPGLLGRLASREPRASIGLRRSGRRARDRWWAAAQAHRTGRVDVAAQLWEELAGDEAHPSAAAAGLVRLAEQDVSAGRTQAALDRARRAAGLLEDVRGTDASRILLLAGTLQARSGDPEAALVTLQRAADARHASDRARAQLELAMVLADLDRVDEATDLVVRVGGGTNRQVGLARLVRANLTLAQAAARVDSMRALTGFAAQAGELADLQYDLAEARDATKTELVQIDAQRAQADLLMGRARIEAQQWSQAVTQLRRAHAVLGETGPPELDLLGRVMLGRALIGSGDHWDGVIEVAAGAAGLEARRRELRSSDLRAGGVVRAGTVHGWALDALSAASAKGSERAGEVAVEIIESLRSNALSSVLRGEDLELPPDAVDLLDQISAIEADEPVGPTEDLRVRVRHTRSLDDRRGVALDALHATLTDQLSEAFASAYLPRDDHYADIRGLAGDADLLLFRLAIDHPSEVSGWRAWCPAGGSPVIERFAVQDVGLLQAMGHAEPMDRIERMRSIPTVWADLGRALLPAALWGRADADDRPLVVVPDGVLGLVPWAGLELEDGRHLVHHGSIQVVTATSLLGTRAGSAAGEAMEIVASFDPELGTAIERLKVQRASGSCTEVAGADELRDVLTASTPAGVYLAGHGDGLGLAQGFEFGDRSVLSAATAMQVRWPGWAFFASCIVGGVRPEAGREPLGLPTSCLLGGAHSVIGGVIPVEDATTAAIGPDALRHLLAGIPPAEALALAQRELLGRMPDAETWTWAGLTCTSVAPPIGAA